MWRGFLVPWHAQASQAEQNVKDALQAMAVACESSVPWRRPSLKALTKAVVALSRKHAEVLDPRAPEGAGPHRLCAARVKLE